MVQDFDDRRGYESSRIVFDIGEGFTETFTARRR